MHPPFTSPSPIRNLADLARLEEIPLEQALPVRSTYEIARNSAHAFGDNVALTFLHEGRPDVERVVPVTTKRGSDSE